MENIRNMKLVCSKTAQIFIINNKAEGVWEGVDEDGRRMYFVVLATQPTTSTPGVDKLVESVPLHTVTALAAKAAASVQPAPTPPRSHQKKPAGETAFKWPTFTPPAPPPERPAPPPVPAGQMHPALRMRLEKAVATLGKKKKIDEHERQQALSLLRTHRDKLSQIPGAEFMLKEKHAKD